MPRRPMPPLATAAMTALIAGAIGAAAAGGQEAAATLRSGAQLLIAYCAGQGPAGASPIEPAPGTPLPPGFFEVHAPDYRPGMRWTYAYAAGPIGGPGTPSRVVTEEVVTVSPETVTLRVTEGDRPPFLRTIDRAAGPAPAPEATYELYGQEPVTVAAGTFDQASKVLRSAANAPFVQWHAPGVGVVKEISVYRHMGHAVQVTRELTAFSPGPAM